MDRQQVDNSPDRRRQHRARALAWQQPFNVVGRKPVQQRRSVAPTQKDPAGGGLVVQCGALKRGAVSRRDIGLERIVDYHVGAPEDCAGYMIPLFHSRGGVALERQHDDELGPLSWPAVQFDRAPMCFSRELAEREPQAGAALALLWSVFGAEALEEPALHVCRNARAGILHPQPRVAIGTVSAE